MGSVPASPYSATAKSLHWLIVALVAVQFVTAFLLPHITMKTQPSTVITLHFSFGLLIVAVMAVRFVHRLAHPVPLAPVGASWERGLASATHRVFYLILLVGPFLGWASASAHGLPVTFFGLFTLPPLAAPRTKWASTAGDVHTWAMYTLLGIIALHVAAALYHELVRDDGTLKRMMPRLG